MIVWIIEIKIEIEGEGGVEEKKTPPEKQLYDYLASSTPAPHAPREALEAFALEASKLGLSVSQAAAAANLVPTREVDAFAIAPSIALRSYT